MKKFLILAFSVCLLCSCEDPRNRKYSEKTLANDLKAIWDKDHDSTDIKSVVGYLMLSAFTKEDLTGKTYKEIIEKQKAAAAKITAAEQEAKILATKTAKESEDRRVRLNNILTVAMYDKGYVEADYQEFLTYDIAFENKSNKDIRAVKGVIHINDLFNDEIKSINLTYDNTISAGSTGKERFTTSYNQFLDEDTRLRSKTVEDLKIVWMPEKIIFTDGSTLE